MNNYATLNEALDAQRTHARTITFIEGEGRESVLSFAELHSRALGLLFHFQARGLGPGDKMIFLLKDNEQFVEAFWACMYGGIVPVPVAVGISDEHRAKLLRIFAKLDQPSIYTEQAALERLLGVAESSTPRLVPAVREKTLLADDMGPLSRPGDAHPAGADDVAFIQFSSGSTREPKGVVLTHRNLMTTVVDLGERAAYSTDDVSLSWMPLTHDLGLIGFHLNMLVFGINQHLLPTDLFSRRPLLWLSKASEKRATLLSSPNFGYKHFLQAYDKKGALENLDLTRVRLILNGAEPISVGLCYRFLEAMAPQGLRREAMYTVYGLAEAALAVSLPVPGREFEHLTLARAKLGVGDCVDYLPAGDRDGVAFPIVGPPVARCAVRIGDREGQDLGADTVGHILIKGPNVTRGYYQDEAANAEVMKGDGWLDTGDLGVLHDGQLIITGRAKDIIFVNGQNYYPHDLEAIALNAGGVELGKVVALGVRPPGMDGDELLVFVLFRGAAQNFAATANEIAHLVNEHIGLEVTHVVPARRIPKTTSGKVQRHLLAKDYLSGAFDAQIAETEKYRQAVHTPDAVEHSELEQVLQRICAEVAPDKTIGFDDNLFDIGISSLTLAQIHERIDERYPGLIDITEIFDHPTLAELAQVLEAKRAS